MMNDSATEERIARMERTYRNLAHEFIKFQDNLPFLASPDREKYHKGYLDDIARMKGLCEELQLENTSRELRDVSSDAIYKLDKLAKTPITDTEDQTAISKDVKFLMNRLETNILVDLKSLLPR